jgi:hypothetical protein
MKKHDGEKQQDRVEMAKSKYVFVPNLEINRHHLTGRVFTARYELDLQIKQLLFVLKGLN